MINKSAIDKMQTTEALKALGQLVANKVINTFDTVAILRILITREHFTVFQLARLQSGIDYPEIMTEAIDLVIADRAFNEKVKSLKESAL